MTTHSEDQSVLNKFIPRELPDWNWDALIDLGENPSEVLEKILSVTEEIIKFDQYSWPDDEYWRQIMPAWVHSFIPELTRDQIEKMCSNLSDDEIDHLPWEFLSWIDALKERSWRWSGVEAMGPKARLVLEIIDIPPRVDAFKQIIFAAGGSIERESWTPTP